MCECLCVVGVCVGRRVWWVGGWVCGGLEVVEVVVLGGWQAAVFTVQVIGLGWLVGGCLFVWCCYFGEMKTFLEKAWGLLLPWRRMGGMQLDGQCNVDFESAWFWESK